MNFYSHAPRGARRKPVFYEPEELKFLLTRPSRGATMFNVRIKTFYGDFYSHAPRGARQIDYMPLVSLVLNFYSHAPRGARREPLLT